MIFFAIGLFAGALVALGLAWLYHRSRPTSPIEEGGLDSLLDAVHDGVVVLSGSRVVMSNRRAGEFLGLAGDPSPARLGMALQRSPELLDYICAPNPGEEPGTVVPVGYPNPRYLRVQASELGGPGGSGEGWTILTLTDVSDLQRLERIRRRFTADISHQIRTPVTAIRLLAEQMVDGAGDPRELASRVLKETDRLTDLSGEILTLSRLEAGEEIPDPQEFPPGELLSEAVDAVKSQAEEAGVEVSIDCDSSKTWRGDYRKILRTLGIYLDNAVKFSPRSGEVRVRAFTEGGRHVITVTDDGPGIPSDELPQVFHRFYRGARTSDYAGFGLGLAIAKHSMVAAGGDVFADSRIGEGSTFGLGFPAVETVADTEGGEYPG